MTYISSNFLLKLALLNFSTNYVLYIDRTKHILLSLLETTLITLEPYSMIWKPYKNKFFILHSHFADYILN